MATVHRWTGEVGGRPAVLFTVREPGHGVVDTAAVVASYAADGSVIATTPVPAFDDGSGVIGEKPATRVVP